MKTLYTDASFNMFGFKLADTHARGRISIKDADGFERIEEVVIGTVPGLKQYINLLELTAIGRAIEIAIEKKWSGGLQILTDSRTALVWALSGVKNKKVRTEAHINAEAYVHRVRNTYNALELAAGGQMLQIDFVPREHNLAGKVFG